VGQREFVEFTVGQCYAIPPATNPNNALMLYSANQEVRALTSHDRDVFPGLEGCLTTVAIKVISPFKTISTLLKIFQFTCVWAGGIPSYLPFIW
jgi:hypothetical protein